MASIQRIRVEWGGQIWHWKADWGPIIEGNAVVGIVTDVF